MDPSLSSSSSEDVSQLSPDHDNETEISSSDIIKSNGKAPKSSSDNELEAGSELSESTALGISATGIVGLKVEYWFENYSAVEPLSESPSTSKEDEYIIVKAKAGDDKEKMNKHEAICLKCSNRFNIADNVLKMKCKCKTLALIHDGCPSDKDCSYCKHPIEYVPVTLLSEDSHPTSPDEKVDQKCW